MISFLLFKSSHIKGGKDKHARVALQHYFLLQQCDATCWTGIEYQQEMMMKTFLHYEIHKDLV